MTYLKRYGLRLLWTILFIGICSVILSTLYYFNILPTFIYTSLEIIFLLINLFISGYLLGKTSKKRGYLEGIKLSSLLIALFFIINILLGEPLALKLLFYYLLIIASSTLGGMVGISKSSSQ